MRGCTQATHKIESLFVELGHDREAKNRQQGGNDP
jgi:hypothetical protein